jgi:muramoyltetrapeptide carboxypeptidase
VGGRAEGVLVGGNLAVLAAEVGTRSSLRAAESIVVLEEVGEEAYRVDRLLTQLLRSGRLEGATGIALGSWEECGPYELLRAVLTDRLGGLGIPVVERFGFGHGEGAPTMPLGVAAELDADNGTLTLEVPALA